MSKVHQSFSIPTNSIIAKGFETYDYIDSYCISIQSEDSVDKITTATFKGPKWVDALMKIRNAIVSVVGLRTETQQHESDYYSVGSKAGLFTVIDRNENELVMSEDDKHLIFRTSILVERNQNECLVHLTTMVQYHNFLGRFYFFFVKPFHQIIMRVCLKQLL